MLPRRSRLCLSTGLAVLGAVAALWPTMGCGREPKPETIALPPGFRIEVFSEELPGARSMCLGAEGTLFVGTRSAGKVYGLVDADGDHRAERVHVIVRGLNQPNGVAFRDGSLYVAEIHRVIRFDRIESRLADPPKPVVVNDRFPRDRHHGWKYIAFGPDGLLYVPVGAPCNVCLREDPRYAAILRMKPDGSDLEVFARGVRNTVGFDWHPVTGELWLTDNGRDWMGDNQPPDELNHAPRPGLHFGFPHWHGRDVPDPEYRGDTEADDFRPPALELGPHVAALGMTFYTGTMFPEPYHHQMFIAEHGSWNRSVPIGYRVMLVRFKDGQPASYTVFAEGWLQGDTAWGRPVDVLVMPDGALLVSDDRVGAVYRISYTPPAIGPTADGGEDGSAGSREGDGRCRKTRTTNRKPRRPRATRRYA